MAKRKKRPKIPTRRKPTPASPKESGWNILSASEMLSLLSQLVDSTDPYSSMERELPTVSGYPLVGSAPPGKRHRYPRREDFPSPEAYYEYHRQSMIACGVPPEEIRMEYVDPEFIASMENDFEGGMRGSFMWNRMVEERGLEATEAHMQTLFAEVRAAKEMQIES